MLAAGPIVQDLSRSFDSYWNNERAYPVQSLITQSELDHLRDSIRVADEGRRRRVAGQGGTTAPDRSPRDMGPDTTAAQRARIWNYEPMDLQRTPFVWAAAAVLVDQPAKIPADGAAAGSVPNGSAPALAPSSPPSLAASPPPGEPGPLNAPSSPKAAAAALVSGSRKVPAADSAPGAQPRAYTNEAQTDTVVDGLLQLMGQARRDVLIISPYFVPGPDMKAAFAAARARGVRVRVLTNSLASNDAPIAHAGYARHRPQLLAMGVQLYEMHSELPGVLRGALGVSGSMGNHSAGVVGSQGGSRAMLHSKLLIVDGRLLAVGSMNLDMRSQRQNTEVALLIRSTELSRLVTTQIDATLRQSAWQVQATDQGLRWRAPEGSGLPDATTEPDASAPLRLMLQLLGPLAPDHLL